jgi:hypothetical protein
MLLDSRGRELRQTAPATILDAYGRVVRHHRDNVPGQGETRKVGAHITEYRDWRRAAEASPISRKAISRPFRMRPPHGSLLGSTTVPLQIVKPASGDPYLVYASQPGHPIEPRPKLNARAVDSIEWWRPFDPEA